MPASSPAEALYRFVHSLFLDARVGSVAEASTREVLITLGEHEDDWPRLRRSFCYAYGTRLRDLVAPMAGLNLEPIERYYGQLLRRLDEFAP